MRFDTFQMKVSGQYRVVEGRDRLVLELWMAYFRQMNLIIYQS